MKPIEALPTRLDFPTLHNPQRWRTDDGRVFWVKTEPGIDRARELIAGRLAHTLGIGPEVAVMEIDGNPALGVEEIQGCHSNRTIGLAWLRGDFDFDTLDRTSWARVGAFQSWLGVPGIDKQALIRLSDGRFFAFDMEIWPYDWDTSPSGGHLGYPQVLGAKGPSDQKWAPPSLTSAVIAEAVKGIPTTWAPDALVMKLAAWLQRGIA